MASTAAPSGEQPDEVERSLSPTQELVMDVLAARLRLGDRLWTFTTKVRPAVRTLAALGLVAEMHGITDHTIRASLTDAGRELWMLSGYTPAGPSAQSGETVHHCPVNASGLTPCCRRTPFELPRTDRMTADSQQVTCAGMRLAESAPDRLAEAREAVARWVEQVTPAGWGGLDDDTRASALAAADELLALPAVAALIGGAQP